MYISQLQFCSQPTFKISIHAIDWDPVGGNDDLGVTSYTYTPNAPLEQTVTTSPGSMNLRYSSVV